AAQAALKSAEASRTVIENKLFAELCARANAETWAQQFSADRDAAHKEIKLVKSREASLNVQISEMNVVIKRHQDMYDRLENRFQLALRSNEILTKEVNHGPSEYLLRERNRDLVRRVKRLEKANSALSSRLRLEDMDPEALVLMVEGLDLDKIDWETLSPDPQTRRALKAVYKVRLEDARNHDTLPTTSPARKFGPSQSSAVPPAHSPPASTPPAPPVSGGKKGKGKAKRRRTGSDDEDVDFGGGDSGEDAREEGRESSATSSSAATSQPQPKKQKASPPASPPTPTEKPQPSSKSSTKSSSSKPPSSKSPSSKSSVPAPAQHKAGSVPKKVDVAVSDAESMSSPRLTPKRKAAMSSEFRSSFRLAGGSRSDIKPLTSKSSPGQSTKSSSKSKKSRSKKTGVKSKSGRSSSDESVISVSSETESESSSDHDSSASEGSEAHEDEESELSKLRPKSQCLEDLPDDTLDAPAPASSSAATSQAVVSSPKPKSKAKSASTTKADSKSSPKGKKKVSPKLTGKKKSSANSSKKKSKSSPKTSRSSKKTKSQDTTDGSSLDTTLPNWISTYPELVKLAQRASDLLTPYVAPEFTTVSAQKYWVKLEQASLPPPVPSDAEIKCTTVGIEKFCKFMDPDHPWRKATDLWPEHACLFDTTDFQPDSHISQRTDYPDQLCGVWRRLRGYGNQEQAVMSFAIYERKHRVSPEAVKRFLSRLATRLSTIKDADERRKFKVALERRMCPDATLPIETLLDPALPFYTIENLMWVPGSADWCAEAALVDKSEPCRVDWLTCPEQHPYNTVYVPCNAHVPLFLPATATVEVLGPQIVPDSSLEPADNDSSWDRAFRAADEDEEVEEGEVAEDDADSTATLDLNQDSGDTSVDPQDASAEAALILLSADSSPPSTSGVVAEI
ncbi:hypothetical protein PHMEG_00026146, partial [Phytophthora megakarya]